MNLSLLGLLIFFAAYAFNRFLMTGETKKLDDADKLKIFGAFSKRNNYSTIFALSIAFLYFAAMQYFPHFLFEITIVYLVLFAFYLVFRFVSNYKKLKQIQMPASYIKSFVISYGIYILSFTAFAGCILSSWIM